MDIFNKRIENKDHENNQNLIHYSETTKKLNDHEGINVKKNDSLPYCDDQIVAIEKLEISEKSDNALQSIPILPNYEEIKSNSVIKTNNNEIFNDPTSNKSIHIYHGKEENIDNEFFNQNTESEKDEEQLEDSDSSYPDDTVENIVETAVNEKTIIKVDPDPKTVNLADNKEDDLIEQPNNQNTMNDVTSSDNNLQNLPLKSTNNKSNTPNYNNNILDSGAPNNVFPTKIRKPTSEGPPTSKINIGPRHQVPGITKIFLTQDNDPYYNDFNDQKTDLAKLVYSPSQMENAKIHRIKEGLVSNTIKTEHELVDYIQGCVKNWKTHLGWHPFTPEFAYKLLHHCNYDPQMALLMLEDPHFHFREICDPPTRRYDNKWKPRDRRGLIPTQPYPPPITLKGYLSRCQSLNTN